MWTFATEGEVSGKEVVSRSGKIVTKLTIPWGEKVLYSTISQPNVLQGGVPVMKKRTIFIRYLLVLILMATFVACASTPRQSSTGEYVDDSVITTKVKAQLAADDFLKSFKISVETLKGTVQLSGFVDSQNAVDKAGQIARGVGGVKSVDNNLIVK
jgi:hyperosmotically inducible protein